MKEIDQLRLDAYLIINNIVELGKIAKYIKLNISTMRKKWDDFKGYAK